MNRFMNYADGGLLDEMDMDAPPSRDPNSINAPDDVKDISFKEAFSRARSARLKSFVFKGKKYSTDLAAPKAKPAAAEPKLLGPTPTKSRGMFSKMFNETRESDRKVVDAAIRGRLAREEAAKKAEPAMMHGGKVKAYAKGGVVSSASKRADGCATKGKTRCRTY